MRYSVILSLLFFTTSAAAKETQCTILEGYRTLNEKGMTATFGDLKVRAVNWEGHCARVYDGSYSGFNIEVKAPGFKPRKIFVPRGDPEELHICGMTVYFHASDCSTLQVTTF